MATTWVDRLSEPQVEQLCALYRETWWTKGRGAADVRRMLEGTDLIVAGIEDGRLVAFARVLTDGVYKALVFDVIVAPAAQSRGLGRALMDQICSHPIVRDVQHLEMYCRPEVEPFYRRWQFRLMNDTMRFLRRER